ncbi:M16 family metallopeptidase [Patescibacteria group bacterium]
MEKYKLKNKMTVLLTPQKETQAVTVLVLVGVGSRYETKKIRGITHFLEHMMFKGTPKRPTTLALSKELDKIGAEFNAYTDKDHTGYYIKSNTEHINLVLDVLSDMVWNSKLEQKEIDREKGTIIEEINMYEDNPMRMIGWQIEELMYNKSSLAWDEGGLKQTVRVIDCLKMKKFKNKHYYPENMVISIAGNFKQDKIKNLIEKYFENNLKNKITEFKKFEKFQKNPQLKIKYKTTEQAHLAFGFLGPKYTSKDLIPTQILSNILGSNMSSRLFINIRERQGLCYFIRSSLNIYQDIGNLTIQAGLDKKRIYQAVELILEELRKFKKQGITYEELKRAKENLKGRMILHLEDSSAVATWYGNQELLIKKIKTPEEKIHDIMKVTKVDVEKVAKKMFQTNKINLALIGPFKDKNKFLNILKI